MDELTGVNVFECFEKLVDDVLDMEWCEQFGSDDSMEIGFHEFEDHVEVFGIVGFDDGDEFDDVVMVVELFEENNFPVSPLSIRRVLESVKNL